MRIPLELINGQLQVVALIKAPKCRVSLGVVSFVVDTGSNRSMLGYNSVERLNLPQNALAYKEDSRIGGSNLGLYSVGSVTLLFTDAAGEGHRIELGSFYAGIPRSKKKEVQDNARHVPSILGLDFLIETGISLHCIPQKKEYYLETAP